jgi:hypothetical protein
MSKLPQIAAALSFSMLVSCVYPPPPPPRFRTNQPYGQEPLGQEDEPYDAPQPLDPNPPQVTPPAPSPPGTGGYPTATPTANPNQVLSPYEPYNVIDTEGFKSGQLARDPSNQKIFRVP